MNNFKIISTKTNVEMQTTLYYLSFTQYYMCNVEFRAGRVGAGIKASGNVQILNPIYSKHQSMKSNQKHLCLSALIMFSVAVDYRGELRGAFMASNLIYCW